MDKSFEIMATTSSPDSDVSSTTVQVATIGGQQLIQSSSGQQFLIVNKALQSSGGRIQIVNSNQEQQEHTTTAKEILDAVKRREILARQPSYCKILNDLKEVESEEELTGDGHQEKELEKTPEVLVKGETIEVVEGSPVTQTVLINGQAYQIMSPVSGISLSSPVNSSPVSNVSNNVQFTASGPNGNSSASSYSSVQTNGSTNMSQAEEQARKREVRLMKNREAAKECRNKKKEYIKCLENRVAVLENQNKALIEELKSLKELYTGQKN